MAFLHIDKIFRLCNQYIVSYSIYVKGKIYWWFVLLILRQLLNSLAPELEWFYFDNWFLKCWQEYDSDDLLLPLQPSLNYVAPELTRSGTFARTSVDIFSLGCIAYHLLARQPLIDAKNNLRTVSTNYWLAVEADVFFWIVLENVIHILRLLIRVW